MGTGIIQPLKIMMIFNTSTSYFHEISFHYFEDYLMTKLTEGKVIAASSSSNHIETLLQVHSFFSSLVL
jgi:hypothetical protein